MGEVSGTDVETRDDIKETDKVSQKNDRSICLNGTEKKTRYQVLLTSNKLRLCLYFRISSFVPSKAPPNSIVLSKLCTTALACLNRLCTTSSLSHADRLPLHADGGASCSLSTSPY